MRIGLFGGTFDPVHLGHVQLADRASEKCGLEKVIFIPAASPPHKLEKNITDFHHRVMMVELALEDRQSFKVSSLEGELPAPNFTIDTLQFLKKHLPDSDELFFLTGVDAFLEIETWKEYCNLLSSIHFIVLQRAGFNPNSLACFAQHLGYIKESGFLKNPQSDKNIYYLDDRVINISSSDVRKKISQRTSLKEFLHHKVERYIIEHSLY
ncbi:MAG: nicotinate (nicotinamide) nucleotide adenylyltransferase [Bacteroidetes bacterium]|nr:nicotinate (nicotinamide) nucleotide adenylyltransferase [Bacteroidota bacterium]